MLCIFIGYIIYIISLILMVSIILCIKCSKELILVNDGLPNINLKPVL